MSDLQAGCSQTAFFERKVRTDLGQLSEQRCMSHKHFWLHLATKCFPIFEKCDPRHERLENSNETIFGTFVTRSAHACWLWGLRLGPRRGPCLGMSKMLSVCDSPPPPSTKHAHPNPNRTTGMILQQFANHVIWMWNDAWLRKLFIHMKPRGITPQVVVEGNRRLHVIENTQYS